MCPLLEQEETLRFLLSFIACWSKYSKKYLTEAGILACHSLEKSHRCQIKFNEDAHALGSVSDMAVSDI